MANHTTTKESAEAALALSPSSLHARFREFFGNSSQPRIFRAPGRVNLIGEHTDYNSGFVMPAAIEFHTLVAAAPSNDNTLTIRSVDYNETKKFDLADRAPSPTHHWSDYVRGVALQLQQTGLPIRGANLLLSGNVPIGAGLSSSASVEVATAYALASLFGSSPDRRTLATLCQRAENEFVGARCGIMDQFVSAHGQSGHALMLDCRTLDYELLPLPQRVSLVVCNTMVKHQIASGEYNLRRRECEQGVALLRQSYPDIQALRDVTPDMLEDRADLLPPVIYRRCRHVVREDARVLAAAQALRDSSLNTFGRLMYESHESLRDDYEVSCPELDAMVEIASKVQGVIGARMTGGGFGGCTINMVEQSAVNQFRTTVAENYHEQTGITPEIYVTQASDGASELSSQS
jgi:galactokinase